MDHPAKSLISIAQSAGVSRSTVWRVLNPVSDTAVSPEIRRRVMAAAEAVGWKARPRAPIRRKRPIIAVVGTTSMPVGLNIHLNSITTLVDQALVYGHDLLPIPLIDGIGQWKREGRNQQVDGAIILDYCWYDIELLVGHLGVPMCLWNVSSPLPVDQVLADEVGGMRLAIEHLLMLGHRRVGWIEPEESLHRTSLNERFDTLMELCRAAGASCQPCVGVKGLAMELDRIDRATALVAYNESLLPGLLDLLGERDLRLPRDIALVVAGNAELTSWLRPAITTIEVPAAAISRRTVDLLVARIADPSRPAVVERIPERLLIRASTCESR